MDEREEIAARGPHDVGGAPAGPFVPTDHALLPWEKRLHALMDLLSVKKVLTVEEKRRGVEDLGREVYDRLTYYERWAVAACNLLLAKGVVTAEELACKLAEVRKREAEHDREVCP